MGTDAISFFLYTNQQCEAEICRKIHTKGN